MAPTAWRKEAGSSCFYIKVWLRLTGLNGQPQPYLLSLKLLPLQHYYIQAVGGSDIENVAKGWVDNR